MIGMVLSALAFPLVMRRSWKCAGLLALLVAVMASAWMTGCGSGSSGGGTSATMHNVAPGTYQQTVTAKSGQASATVILTLVVQ